MGELSALGLLRAAVAQCTDVDIDRVVPEAKMLDLGIDSLELTEVIWALEDLMGNVNLDPSNSMKSSLPATVGEVLALIDAARAQQGA